MIPVFVEAAAREASAPPSVTSPVGSPSPPRPRIQVRLPSVATPDAASVIGAAAPLVAEVLSVRLTIRAAGVDGHAAAVKRRRR